MLWSLNTLLRLFFITRDRFNKIVHLKLQLTMDKEKPQNDKDVYVYSVW